MFPYILAGIAGLMAWLNRPIQVRPEEFFRPDLVSDLAKTFPQDDDGFIQAAWNYVAKSIVYEPIGSDMIFINDKILCEDCRLPQSVLTGEKGNCIAKSALLASILMHRLPVSRIHIIVGSYGPDRDVGGHAWAEVFRQGRWYLLETTKAPGGWVLADDMFPLYDPGVLIAPDKVMVADSYYDSSPQELAV